MGGTSVVCRGSVTKHVVRAEGVEQSLTTMAVDVKWVGHDQLSGMTSCF